jgi:hypothetical protein
MKRRLARIAAGFREFHALQRELLERQHLANRPWEEQYLHWSYDGTQWHLHGHLPPPSKRRCSTTRGGWCPGNLRQPLGRVDQPPGPR